MKKKKEKKNELSCVYIIVGRGLEDNCAYESSQLAFDTLKRSYQSSELACSKDFFDSYDEEEVKIQKLHFVPEHDTDEW